MKRFPVRVCIFMLATYMAITALSLPAKARAGDAHPCMGILESEMKLSMEKLVSKDGTKPYFIQYLVVDSKSIGIEATLGSLTSDYETQRRSLDVSVRCGDYKIDSTRQIRDSDMDDDESDNNTTLPMDGDPLATRHAVWLQTDATFKSAVKRLAQVKANLKVKVEEEDPSDDFSRETPSSHIAPWLEQSYDRAALTRQVRDYSRRFRDHPDIYSSSVSLRGSTGNQITINTEGSRVQYGQGNWRIGISASTIADDGMDLWQYRSFDSADPGNMPKPEEVNKAIDQVIQELLALRRAPIVEPYTGPAILLNRASGVFFHEIFGHRIEGHRQKDVDEGQTFAKKLGKEVLPCFLGIVDDPSLKRFKGIDLNGHYPFDDECVPAQPTVLVEKGVLKTFLMARSPTRGINKSNGHGRCQMGSSPVSRQGNLIIKSARTMPFAKLREALIAEVKKQNKDYGLLFSDISGGFTNTERWDPQAFKVTPILVYKVFADGRPDELVRGVDIVGTPLTCFSKILATADDDDVFNGTCGAESGWIPVSAISPSILVEQIEIEKKRKSQDRPPILEPPIAEERGAARINHSSPMTDKKEEVQ